MSKKLFNKRGFTLVESLAAVVILSIFVTAILSSVLFSRTQLALLSSRTAALSKTKGVVETLISAYSAGETTTSTLEARTGAHYTSGSISYNASYPTQFTYVYSTQNGCGCYALTVVTYYGTRGDKLTLTGVAVNTGIMFLQ